MNDSNLYSRESIRLQKRNEKDYTHLNPNPLIIAIIAIINAAIVPTEILLLIILIAIATTIHKIPTIKAGIFLDIIYLYNPIIEYII